MGQPRSGGYAGVDAALEGLMLSRKHRAGTPAPNPVINRVPGRHSGNTLQIKLCILTPIERREIVYKAVSMEMSGRRTMAV